jgi:regulator of RNase E activity RraA
VNATLLNGLTTGTIAYVLHQIGFPGCFMHGGVRPVTSVTRFAGRARTLRTLPTRADVVEANQKDRAKDPHRVAIDQAGEGDVLVIDARGVLEAAVLGDVLAARVRACGAAGIVTDGCVRDLPGLEKLNFPVFAAGVNATLFGTKHVGIDVNVPIACGGVLVKPGDVVVGDEEGVIVVPAHLETKLAEMCAERDELDAFILTKIEQGQPVAKVFPPDEATKAEFERQRPHRR